MNSKLEYKGYCASVEYDEEDEIYVGKVDGITDSINFHGKNIQELEKMFEQSVEHYQDLCGKIGKKKLLCANCYATENYVIKEKESAAIIDGKEYHYEELYGECEKCNEEMYVPGLSEINRERIDYVYRGEHSR